jgi:hypothetical protein
MHILWRNPYKIIVATLRGEFAASVSPRSRYEVATGRSILRGKLNGCEELKPRLAGSPMGRYVGHYRGTSLTSPRKRAALALAGEVSLPSNNPLETTAGSSSVGMANGTDQSWDSRVTDRASTL